MARHWTYRNLGLRLYLILQLRKFLSRILRTVPLGEQPRPHYGTSGFTIKLASQFVVAENVSQAAQIVVSREAQVGLIALSLATAMKGQGRYWMVPPDAYPPLNQTAVMLSHSQQQEGARQFLDFLHSPEAASVLDSYGLSTEKH